MLSFLRKDPAAEVEGGVRALISKARSFSPEDQRFFFEMHLFKTKHFATEALPDMLYAQPSVRENAYVNVLARELDALLSPASAALQRGAFEAWENDVALLRALVFSNVIAYEVARGTGALSEVWSIYAGACLRLGIGTVTNS